MIESRYERLRILLVFKTCLCFKFSYNSVLVGHQIFVRNSPTRTSLKRHRFRINHCCSFYKQTFTITMSAENNNLTGTIVDQEVPIGPVDPIVSFEDRQKEQQEELEEERKEAPDIPIGHNVGEQG